MNTVANAACYLCHTPCASTFYYLLFGINIHIFIYIYMNVKHTE